MATQRDSQRSKVYAAEDAAFTRNAAPTMKSLDEVEAYVKKVLGSAWFQKRYLICNVNVEDGRGRRNAYANALTNTIKMPKWSRSEWVILHEISHLVSSLNPAHGWQFCENYLALVQHFLGKESADRLRREFKARRVKFTKPRAKRVLTAEQKARLAERLVVARAAKASKVAV